MKKIFFYSFSFFMLLSFTALKAQNAANSNEVPISNNNPALKEDAMKAKAQRIETQKNKHTQLAAVSKPIVKSPLDENDIYMGRKAEFLGNMTVSELPSDFPKYDKSYGLGYYNNLVDNYYGAHKDILKDYVRQKIEHNYPSGKNQQLNTK